MSPSAYRYQPVANRNAALKEKIIALAQRHRRYGAGMIYLKLRQAGEIVNHKRVDRLYADAGRARVDGQRDRDRKHLTAAQPHLVDHPGVVVLAEEPVERREPARREQPSGDASTPSAAEARSSVAAAVQSSTTSCEDALFRH